MKTRRIINTYSIVDSFVDILVVVVVHGSFVSAGFVIVFDQIRMLVHVMQLTEVVGFVVSFFDVLQFISIENDTLQSAFAGRDRHPRFRYAANLPVVVTQIDFIQRRFLNDMFSILLIFSKVALRKKVLI